MGMVNLVTTFLRQFCAELRLVIVENKKAVVIVLALCFVGFVGCSVAVYRVAEAPWFCGACHNMEPYILSWKESKHREVVCVDCHYKPGLLNHLKGKLTDGQLSLVYFITGKGPSKPHAEIPDESCLQCHPYTEVVENLLDYKGIFFEHKHHLGTIRNGMQLRCTSCHSQIVQGEHLTVTESVCFQCHFYETARTDRQRLCRTCHTEVKDVLLVDGMEFRHGDYVNRGLECTGCHRYVIKGDGRVRTEKCAQCHDEREILETGYSHRHLHLNHVTMHKVECYVCHTTFEHRIVEEVVGDPGSCDKCHPVAMHSPQRDLYSGKGGVGVVGSPMRMFQKHVDCSGCHAWEPGETVSAYSSGLDFKAIAAACVDCHGVGFDQMLENWQRVLATALAATEARVLKTETALQSLGKSLKERQSSREAERLLGEARYNWSYVTMAKGIHNIEYALKLLNVADKKAEGAYNLVQKEKMPPVSELALGCAELCHVYIRDRDVKLVDGIFPHAAHIDDLELSCLECHTPRSSHGQTVMKNCNDCHHADTPVNCVNCHRLTSEIYAGIGGEGVPKTPSLKAALGVGCSDCHGAVKEGRVSDLAAVKTRCAQCHDEEMVGEADEWVASGQALLAGFSEKIERAEDLLHRADRRGINIDLIEKKFFRAKKNVEFVGNANPAHNLKYAQLLLQWTAEVLEDVIKTLNDKLYG